MAGDPARLERGVDLPLQRFQSKEDLTLGDLDGLELEEFVLLQFLGSYD
ncbi:MAG: hypothetical protein ACRD1R_06735 [Acidobacteriota bacterium]